MQLGVAVGVVGCCVAEGGGLGSVVGLAALGEGFAGGSAGSGAAGDAGGSEGDAEVEAVLLDGLGRVVVADGCGRAVTVVVVAAGAGAREAGVPGVAAEFCEGDPAPAESGVTAPSELPPASRTVASPQTTSPAADTATTAPRGRPPRRRADRPADRPADRGGGADAVAGTSLGCVGGWCAASPVVASAVRPQPGQESAPLR